ncbi:hypothetical protein VCV18_005299 [Metarhizium anisopliae]
MPLAYYLPATPPPPLQLPKRPHPVLRLPPHPLLLLPPRGDDLVQKLNLVVVQRPKLVPNLVLLLKSGLFGGCARPRVRH